MRASILFICLLSGLFFAHMPSALTQDWASHHNMSAADYQSKFTDYVTKGYRLSDVDGYSINGTPFFAAIWEKTTSPVWVAHHNMTSAGFQQKFDDYSSQGYRPVLVDGYDVNGTLNFAAIWEKTTGPAWVAHHNMTSGDYQEKFNNYTQQGFRLKWVSGYALGSTVYYAAIWDKSTGLAWTAHLGMNATDYQSKFNSYADQGYRPILVSTYNVGNVDNYAVIWEKKVSPAWVARHRMTSMGYQNEFDNQYYSGFKLVNVSGCARNGRPAFAGIWESTGLWSDIDRAHIDQKVNAFMQQFSVPGSAIALVKDGRLVFAKGYGTMDKSTGEVPGPNTLFRIASVSKPITAIAMMKQIEAGRYNMVDRVFGAGSLLGTTYGVKPYSDNEKNITLQQLLEHTAGGKTWNNKSDDGTDDPMFQQPSTHAQLIGWVLDNRDPESMPGTKYDYSNFGYCVLGRIIEKFSRQTYENYVRDNVLGPCGITNMYIGANDLAGRRYNETVYYDASSNPYSMQVRRMDAHGGWLASPIDLVKLLVRTDGFTSKPDILSSSSFSTMTKTSDQNPGYAKGWQVNGSNFFHNGSLPGTGSILVRTGGGLSWAFVMNSRWQGEADSMIWNIVNGIKNWPVVDLF